MSLNGQPASSDPQRSLFFDNSNSSLPQSQLPSLPWDWKTDVTRFTGSSIDPANPSPDFAMTGILWSHVTELNSLPTSEQQSSNGRNYSDFGNHYSALDPRYTVRGVGTQGIPRTSCSPANGCFRPDLWPWWAVTCIGPACNPAQQMAWLWAVNPDPISLVDTRFFALTQSAATRIDDFLATEAKKLLASGAKRISASEPAYRLQQHGVMVREVLWDTNARTLSGSLGLTSKGAMVGLAGNQALVNPGRVSVPGGELPSPQALLDTQELSTQQLPSSTAIEALPGNKQPILAFSGVRGELFALLDGNGSQPASLWSWTPRSRWTALPLAGQPIRGPKAMAFDLQNHALWVLEQANVLSPVRLVRIDLLSNEARLQGIVTLAGGNPRVSLTMGHDGELIVAVSRKLPAMTRFARLSLDQDRPRLLDWALVPGQVMASDVYSNHNTVQYISESLTAYQLRSIEVDDFIDAPSWSGPWCP
jgi:hypothetical protein